MTKTTKKQFEVFKKEFNRWVDIFGLKEYKIYFCHEHLKDNFAQIETDEAGKCATVSMALWLDGLNLKSFNPKESAKHEAIHLLLNRLVVLGDKRHIAEKDINNEWERLVRILEKAL